MSGGEANTRYFQDRRGDIWLKSSDGVVFQVSKSALAYSSEMLADMFDLNPDLTVADRDGSKSNPLIFPDTSALVKYLMGNVKERLSGLLLDPSFVAKDPFGAYLVSRKLGWHLMENSVNYRNVVAATFKYDLDSLNVAKPPYSAMDVSTFSFLYKAHRVKQRDISVLLGQLVNSSRDGCPPPRFNWFKDPCLCAPSIKVGSTFYQPPLDGLFYFMQWRRLNFHNPLSSMLTL